MLIVELFLMSIKLIVRFGPFIKFKLNDYFKIVLIKSFYKELDFQSNDFRLQLISLYVHHVAYLL